MSASTLSHFQDAFARALFGEADATMTRLAGQPGFSVYRNTVMKGCVDALVANFPAVTRLVGEEWMRAAAAVYVRDHPPRDPRMMIYGEGYGAFLERFEPARELGYLPAVAQLDYRWCEAHVAPDAPALCGAAIAAMAPDVLARAVLVPHPAARWAWFDHAPVARIWRANRVDAGAEVDLSDLPAGGDGVLITRPQERVMHVPVDRAACAFLDACAGAGTVEQAALAALGASPEADFATMMAMLVEAGAFTAVKE